MQCNETGGHVFEEEERGGGGEERRRRGEEEERGGGGSSKIKICQQRAKRQQFLTSSFVEKWNVYTLAAMTSQHILSTIEERTLAAFSLFQSNIEAWVSSTPPPLNSETMGMMSTQISGSHSKQELTDSDIPWFLTVPSTGNDCISSLDRILTFMFSFHNYTSIYILTTIIVVILYVDFTTTTPLKYSYTVL